ncbi:MAG: S-adenosylmethionine decarboxylase [Candidatus Kerfeldbacteria bacterium]
MDSTPRCDKIYSKDEYDETGAWGLYTSIDLYGCEPELLRDEENIRNYTHELCDRLGVKRFEDTKIVEFGDDPRVHGYSMVQLIESSLVSGHFANESDAVYMDIFSCKFYDVNVVVETSKKFFKTENYILHTNLRK